ncbi:MAG: DUF1492 domain-containing protein [Clostridiales bacterium]|nr:DUF1492 domain-containing protein [Clostridiales bacterium]
MTAKEYLGQAYCFNQKIKDKIAELESYRELAMSISSLGFDEKFKTTMNTEPPFVRYSNKIMDIEREINEDLITLGNLKYDIGLEIDKLESAKEKTVLRYCYLMFMSWDEIADKMNFSERWVRKISGKALTNFKKLKENSEFR